MGVANPSKRKGTAFERQVADWLKDNGFPDADRSVLRGNKDRGDIIGLACWCLELKATRQIDLAGALDEAAREAKNLGTEFYAAVIKRRRKSVAAAYVVMPLKTFVRLTPR